MSKNLGGQAQHHFLVVENNPDDAFLITRAFKKVPHCGTLSLARNTSEAKAYLAGAGMYSDRRLYPVPSAILSDFSMEGETGVQLLAWMKKDPELSRIPFVLLTGSASEKDMQKAERLGAVKVLKKSADSLKLQAIVENLAEWLCSLESRAATPTMGIAESPKSLAQLR